MKTSVGELAIFGGQPAFESLLHVGRPNIGDRGRFLERVDDMLDRRWLTNGGRYSAEFEDALARYLGVQHCVAVSNATTGLEILMRALDLRGEVIVPSFTFVATVHAADWVGLTPVFCDIDPATHNIDPARARELVSPNTAAILGVHVWGRGCDVDALSAIADERAVPLIFDAAHALGCTWKGRRIGGFGDAEVFSFHATKFVNAFEGGAIATNNAALADRLRMMRNFGFADYDHVVSCGTNGKMSEVSAAMGLTSLESIAGFIETNRRNYDAYARALDGIRGVSLVPYDHAEEQNFQYVVIEIDADAAGLSRDDLAAVLRAENVMARRYFHPACHRMEPYATRYPGAGTTLPATERLTARVLQLPTGTAITADDAECIAGIVRACITHGADIARRRAANLATGSERA